MIAFLDSEFNKSNNKNDWSIIEVALIVKENITSSQVIAMYHAYVKPIKNDGKIYENIKKLTGISQEELDNGISFEQMMDELEEFAKKYHIRQIYTWSGCDRYAFIWCLKNKNMKVSRWDFVHTITDISPMLKNKIEILDDIALSDISYICNCINNNRHNALNDALELSLASRTIIDNNYSRKRLKEYKDYAKAKKKYIKLKNAIIEIENLGLNFETLLQLAINKKKFPSLGDYLDKRDYT